MHRQLTSLVVREVQLKPAYFIIVDPWEYNEKNSNAFVKGYGSSWTHTLFACKMAQPLGKIILPVYIYAKYTYKSWLTHYTPSYISNRMYINIHQKKFLFITNKSKNSQNAQQN